MRHDSPLALDVLRWLTRLPFLAVDDIALLTGQPGPDVEGVLREVKQDWLVDTVTPSSPELESAPLHVLTEPTRGWLRSTLDGETVRRLPLAWRDIVHNLARLEAAAAFNTFAAALVASTHRSADREVPDLHALPMRRPQDAWWPPGVQGYGCIRAVAGAAPFFVFVDRAGAPSAHRAALIAGWYRFREGPQPWGYDIPPIIVLCPGRVREGEWARAVLASAEIRDVVPLRILLGSVESDADEPGHGTWWASDGSGRGALVERLTVWHNGHHNLPSTRMPAQLPPASGEARKTLHHWARDVAAGTRTATSVERSGGITLATSTVEKQLIECLGHHPLLSEPELAVVLPHHGRVVRGAVERAIDLGLIFAVERPGDGCQRYCLAWAGLQLLAMRDGVPVRRYARHAPITVGQGGAGRRVPTALQQYEHTVGANRFFVAWIDRPAGGPQLVSWLSATESAIRFQSGGRRRWLRPDGAGALRRGEEAFAFLLEWDRGTERPPILVEKLARYAEYYHSCRTSGADCATLLFVTTTPQREEQVWQLAARLLRDAAACLRTTTAALLERRGPAHAIWRTDAGQHRTTWPSPPSITID